MGFLLHWSRGFGIRPWFLSEHFGRTIAGWLPTGLAVLVFLPLRRSVWLLVPFCNDPAPIAYIAGLSEHIHQSGHPLPLGLYIGFTRLHGVALLREGTIIERFDSRQDHFAFRTGLPAWQPKFGSVQ